MNKKQQPKKYRCHICGNSHNDLFHCPYLKNDKKENIEEENVHEKNVDDEEKDNQIKVNRAVGGFLI